MSFVVREVSRTADGREIVRPTTFDKAVLTIGRGTANDIHLTDLAATLHHAQIHAQGPDRIVVTEVNGLQLDVDGNNVRRAEIEVDTGGIIRIGSHSLAVSRGDGGEIVIKVERVGEISEASEYIDEVKAFSLAGIAPGKRAGAWVLALLVVAAFLVWPLWSFYQDSGGAETAAVAGGATAARKINFEADHSWSPGKLSQAHKMLENDCKACHVEAFVSVRDDSCRTCHVNLHDHADPRRLAAAMQPPGIGGRFQNAVASAFNKPEGSCVECHTEHEGAGPMPVTAQKFCTDCHGGLDTRLTDTKIANAGDFSDDHAQFRPLILTNWNGPKPQFRRMSLDSVPREDSGLKFPHALHLSATNGVARMAQSMRDAQGFGDRLDCKDCHTRDSSGAAFKPVSMEGDCQMCHSLGLERSDGVVRTMRHGDPRQVIADLRDFYAIRGPARPDSMGGMARRRPGDFAAVHTAANYDRAVANGGQAQRAIRALFSEGGACYDCHIIEGGGTNVKVHPVKLADRYMFKGWFDHSAHETESCSSCHAAPASNASTDVLLPKIDSCRACHGGESASKAVPSSCAMCHDYHFSPGAPTASRLSNPKGKKQPVTRIASAE